MQITRGCFRLSARFEPLATDSNTNRKGWTEQRSPERWSWRWRRSSWLSKGICSARPEESCAVSGRWTSCGSRNDAACSSSEDRCWNRCLRQPIYASSAEKKRFLGVTLPLVFGFKKRQFVGRHLLVKLFAVFRHFKGQDGSSWC